MPQPPRPPRASTSAHEPTSHIPLRALWRAASDTSGQQSSAALATPQVGLRCGLVEEDSQEEGSPCGYHGPCPDLLDQPARTGPLDTCPLHSAPSVFSSEQLDEEGMATIQEMPTRSGSRPAVVPRLDMLTSSTGMPALDMDAHWARLAALAAPHSGSRLGKAGAA